MSAGVINVAGLVVLIKTILEYCCCCLLSSRGRGCLSSESVEGSSLSLQGVDDVHGGDGLSAGVLGVGDGITDDVLEEHLEDTSGLLVDEAGDTLDTSTSRQSSDGRLGDSLDVITQDLPVTLGATLSESLSSLSSSSHGSLLVCVGVFYVHVRLVASLCERTFRGARTLVRLSQLSVRKNQARRAFDSPSSCTLIGAEQDNAQNLL